VGWEALLTLAAKVRLALHGNTQAPGPQYPQRMALGLLGFARPVLLLLSGKDLVAHEFMQHCHSDPIWQQALQHPALHTVQLADADHTFSYSAQWQQVLELTLQHVLNHTPEHVPGTFVPNPPRRT